MQQLTLEAAHSHLVRFRQRVIRPALCDVQLATRGVGMPSVRARYASSIHRVLGGSLFRGAPITSHARAVRHYLIGLFLPGVGARNHHVAAQLRPDVSATDFHLNLAAKVPAAGAAAEGTWLAPQNIAIYVNLKCTRAVEELFHRHLHLFLILLNVLRRLVARLGFAAHFALIGIRIARAGLLLGLLGLRCFLLLLVLLVIITAVLLLHHGINNLGDFCLVLL
mmetsp:Transcript_20427/g.51986  ORF Transcript_20427/g.51986 Transcript_20427/m.51986 type:complete len:223 (-) Transcript_20427:179-847(-)